MPAVISQGRTCWSMVAGPRGNEWQLTADRFSLVTTSPAGVVAIDCQSSSFLPDSSLPTFPASIVNAAFGPDATVVATCDASVATISNVIWSPPDPASVEPRFGNYKRTQCITRPPSALRRWCQGLVFEWSNQRSTGVKPDGADSTSCMAL